MNNKFAPVIILVNPQMGENIGMCARAMLNCGVTELRLVAPRDGWPNEAARSASSRALSVVDQAAVYPTLAAAIADCHFVVATTARSREMVKPVVSPEMAAQSFVQNPTKSAIVFGPERAGLINDDVALCDAILNIPLNPDYTSLNLSQAVLLTCYEWWKLQEQPALVQTAAHEPASKAEFDSIMHHLVDALDDKQFFAVEKMRPVLMRNIRNTLQKAMLSTGEIRGLHGMIKALHGKSWK